MGKGPITLQQAVVHFSNPENCHEFMTKLRYRVAIFHGLEERILQPRSIDEIGMPDDISYDERIYRIGFDIGSRVPVEDRIVLEVLSSSGERLGKFHLEF